MRLSLLVEKFLILLVARHLLVLRGLLVPVFRLSEVKSLLKSLSQHHAPLG